MTDSEYRRLVEFLSGQFTQIDARFEQMDARFAVIDRRFDRMDVRFEQIDARLDRVDARFDQIDARLEAVDRRFGEIDRRLGQLDGRSVGFDARLAALEGRFAAFERRSEEQFREIIGRFEDTNRRLERLEAEYFTIVQTLRRIEALIGTEQAQRAVLEQSVGELRQQVVDLQARLDAVESRLQG